MRKLITLILIVLLAGCAKAESGPGASFEDVDIDAIYESFQRSFSYVHMFITTSITAHRIRIWIRIMNTVMKTMPAKRETMILLNSSEGI